jgi:hypothetical protein
MKTQRRLAAIGIAVLTTLAPSLFADDRPHRRTEDWRGRSTTGRVVTLEGRVRAIDRERNGYVIEIDRYGAVFADSRTDIEARGRRDRRDRRELRGLERGDWIRVTARTGARGIVHATRIIVEEDRTVLAGRVESIDSRRGSLVVRDERTGRRVEVDLRDVERRDRDELARLRRGSWIEVRGEWTRNRFVADRIEVEHRGLF